MNWSDLIQKAQGQINSGGFLSEPPEHLSGDNCDEWEYVNGAPCPDFWELLPSEITDPTTGKPVFLSQSFIYNFIQVIRGELCPRRFYETSIERSVSEESGNAAEMGTRFEYLLTGAKDYDGEEPGPMLTGTGKPSADERRIQQNVKAAREVFLREWRFPGVDPDELFTEDDNSPIYEYLYPDVDKRWFKKCLSGKTDLFYYIENCDGPDEIKDIKYSGLLGDAGKWVTELGWSVERVAGSFKHNLQSRHYKLIIEAVTGQPATFEFWVFDNRANHEGEYQIFEFDISETAMNEHKWLILKVVEELENWFSLKKFTTAPTYSACKKCPVATCPDRSTYPEKITFKI